MKQELINFLLRNGFSINFQLKYAKNNEVKTMSNGLTNSKPNKFLNFEKEMIG